MADLRICAGLSIVETLVVSHLAGISNYSFPKAAFGLLLVQYALVKYYRIFLYPFYFSPLRHLPGPKDNHIFFGQFIKQFQADGPTALYTKWMRENPEAPFIRYLSFANTETLVINNLGAHKEVLANNSYAFPISSSWKRAVWEIIGTGLATMDGEQHKAHRKMIINCFSPRNLRKLEPVFRAKAKDLCHLFERAIDAQEIGDQSAVIEASDTFSKTTLDVMGKATLGIELSNMESTTFTDTVATVADPESGSNKGLTFYHSYHTLFTQDTFGKVLLALGGFVPVRWIPCEANRKFKAAMDGIHQFLTDAIYQRRNQVRDALATGKYEKTNSRDVLTFIAEESLLPDGAAEGIKEDEIKGHLLQFMVAGHETSANMLSWCLYLMGTRPDLQDKVRKEIMDLVERTPGGEPSFAEIDALPYLECFMKESLRVYPPATTIHREADHNVTVEGVFIPKATPIDLIPGLTGQNPTIWGENVMEVNPDRWNELQGNQNSVYAFGPFSNGPRICIGRTFVLMEIKTILFEIARNYRFSEVEKPFVLETPSFVLRPAGMEIRIHKLG